MSGPCGGRPRHGHAPRGRRSAAGRAHTRGGPGGSSTEPPASTRTPSPCSRSTS